MKTRSANRLEEPKAKTENCESPNRGKRAKATSKLRQVKIKNKPKRVLSEERKERRRISCREYRASLTDEQKEKVKAQCRDRNSKRVLTEEQKEKRRIWCRLYQASLTDEQKEKKKARRRTMYAELTKEQRDRSNALCREKYAKITDEQRLKRNAYFREMRSMWTDDQREKKRACLRQYNSTITDEQRQKRNARDRERRAKLKKGKVQLEKKEARKKEAGPKVTNEQEKQRKVNQRLGQQQQSMLDDSAVKHIKFSDDSQEQCETSIAPNMEECTPGIGKLDYFEECEDWMIRIKMESDVDEHIKFSDVSHERCETSIAPNMEECTPGIGKLDYFEECEDWMTPIKTESDVDE